MTLTALLVLLAPAVFVFVMDTDKRHCRPKDAQQRRKDYLARQSKPRPESRDDDGFHWTQSDYD